MAKQSFGADPTLVKGAAALAMSEIPRYDFSAFGKTFQGMVGLMAKMQKQKKDELDEINKNAADAADLYNNFTNIDGIIKANVPTKIKNDFIDAANSQAPEINKNLAILTKYGVDTAQGRVAKSELERLKGVRTSWAKTIATIETNAPDINDDIQDKLISRGENQDKINTFLNVLKGKQSAQFEVDGSVTFQGQEKYSSADLFSINGFKTRDQADPTRALFGQEMQNAANAGQAGKWNIGKQDKMATDIRTSVYNLEEADLIELAVGKFKDVEGPMGSMSVQQIKEQIAKNGIESVKEQIANGFIDEINKAGNLTQAAYEEEEKIKAQKSGGRPTPDERIAQYLRDNFGKATMLSVKNLRFRQTSDKKGYTLVAISKDGGISFEQVVDPQVYTNPDQIGGNFGISGMTWRDTEDTDVKIPGEE